MFDYLGMELDFESCPGTKIISMIKYLQKVIAEFPELIEKTTDCEQVVRSRTGCGFFN